MALAPLWEFWIQHFIIATFFVKYLFWTYNQKARETVEL